MSIRIQKVEELLREELSRLIQEDLTEEFGLISVTRVLVTPDLKQAKVYLAVADKDIENKVLKKLTDSRVKFQHLINRQTELRYTPKLTFEIDRAGDDVSRVEKILEEIESGS